MTIPEYFEVRKLLKEAPPEVKAFLRDICRAAGHEWFKDPREFADVCTRCEEIKSWMNNDSLKKIASAMTAPLGQKLDYQVMKEIIATEKIEQPDLPVYDNDLPQKFGKGTT